MDEQKRKLVDNDYHDHDSIDYETDDTLKAIEPAFSSKAAINRLRAKRLGRIALFILTGLLFAAAFYLLGLYFPAVPVSNRSYLFNTARTAHCGNTTAEAKANGCVIDLISGAWVHPACYDQELEKEFLEYGDWKWYADPKGETELSEEFMRTTPPDPVWVSLAYHDAHCAFTWRKLHRAAMRGTPIDSQIGSYVHTNHCSGALSKARFMDPSMFPKGIDPSWKAPSGFYEIFTHCDLVENCEFVDPLFFLVYDIG